MGKRPMEHGAVVLYNCCRDLENLLLAEQAGQAGNVVHDLSLEVLQQHPKGP